MGEMALGETRDELGKSGGQGGPHHRVDRDQESWRKGDRFAMLHEDEEEDEQAGGMMTDFIRREARANGRAGNP